MTELIKKTIEKLFKRPAMAFAMMVALLVLPSCSLLSAARPVLADVAAVATDAQTVLDLVESAVRSWFSQRPDPELERQVVDKLDTCRLALVFAIDVTKGAEDLDDKKAFEAFERFRKAYESLTTLLVDLGVMQRGSGTFALAKGSASIPPPQAMTAFRE